MVPTVRPERGGTTNTARTLLAHLQLLDLRPPCPLLAWAKQRVDVRAEGYGLSERPEQQPTFGALLRRLRRDAGLTQEELASQAGLTPNAVSALERGERRRPYPHTVRSLADALGIPEGERPSFLASVPKRGATGAEATILPVRPPSLPCRIPRHRSWAARGRCGRSANFSAGTGRGC
jgi:transcriptional regulator with XRE-family HTH domain